MMRTLPHANAFPGHSELTGPEHGLTKREYFAALALQGLFAQSDGWAPEDAGEFAARCADALINALNGE